MNGNIVPIVTGVVVPTLTSWLSDQLPSRSVSAQENERRTKNIVLAIMVGFGVGYLAQNLLGKQQGGGTTETTELVKVD
jgi:uncharacterized membrane protein